MSSSSKYWNSETQNHTLRQKTSPRGPKICPRLFSVGVPQMGHYVKGYTTSSGTGSHCGEVDPPPFPLNPADDTKENFRVGANTPLALVYHSRPSRMSPWEQEQGFERLPGNGIGPGSVNTVYIVFASPALFFKTLFYFIFIMFNESSFIFIAPILLKAREGGFLMQNWIFKKWFNWFQENIK